MRPFNSLFPERVPPVPLLIFLAFFCFYVFLAWVVSGGEYWWVIDYVDNQNVFYGDDAYRFFLTRSAWLNPELYTYNFVLPGQLFLDGILTTVTDGDLFWSRVTHALVGALSLSLVFASGTRLGASRSIMLLAVLVLGLVPRYALMSLSFYGEVWLGFTLCLALWLYLKGSMVWMSLVAGWLPLMRPEGIFFLAPLWLALVVGRRWKEALILVLPGFAYFVYLNLALSSLNNYMFWRHELRDILEKLAMITDKWGLVDTYSYWFTVPALLGAFCLRDKRQFWPFLAGAGIWFTWLQLSILMDQATLEKRYTYVFLPLIALLWAIFFSRWVQSRDWKSLSPVAAVVVAVVFASMAVFSHVAQTTAVSAGVRAYGLGGFFERAWQGRWHEIYEFYAFDYFAAWEKQTDRIETMLRKDPGIDKVVIFDSVLYYSLDPRQIPDHVTIGFPSSGYMVFHFLLDGQAFIQHPGGKMYSYLNYGEPDFDPNERRALVVDIMPLRNYPHTWKEERYELYLFSYLESLEPQTDLEKRPMITPRMIQRAYEKWYEPGGT